MEKQLHHLLINKNPDLEEIKKLCLDHRPFLEELIENLIEKQENIRYNSVRILTLIAEESPEKLYPHWDALKSQLYAKNTFHILTGIILISRLVRADEKNLFSEIADFYFNIINHPNVIPARYLLLDIWRVGKAKPEYIPRIREILLSIDGTHHEHKGLLKGDAIIAFAELWNLLDNKEEIINFVKDQARSDSPKTRKEVKKFIEQFGELE